MATLRLIALILRKDNKKCLLWGYTIIKNQQLLFTTYLSSLVSPVSSSPASALLLYGTLVEKTLVLWSKKR